ncbi:MAG: hypothetical protein JW929_08570 [Anaerolineales bacterium]|nr:hypothetical protein [Anaerolineales bacterium]
MNEDRVHRIGPTTPDKAGSSGEWRRFLSDPIFGSETILIKTGLDLLRPGGVSDAETMRMLLEDLYARVIVVESYSLAHSLSLSERGGMLPGRGKPWSGSG